MKRFTLALCLFASLAIAGSITVGRPFTNQFRAWFLTDTSDTESIDESQNGIGWADGRFTIQTPGGAFQFGLDGDPEEPTIWWPGRIEVGEIDSESILGEIDASQVTSGSFPGAVMTSSMTLPMQHWQDSATWAGAHGLTYANTGPASTSEPNTPGTYFAGIVVTDGGSDARNAIEGRVWTHAQMAVSKSLFGSATLNFPNTTTGSTNDLTITVTGAADGDVVTLGVPNGSQPSGICAFKAWVSASNTVTVRFMNSSGSDSDPASGTFKATVLQ